MLCLPRNFSSAIVKQAHSFFGKNKNFPNNGSQHITRRPPPTGKTPVSAGFSLIFAVQGVPENE